MINFLVLSSPSTEDYTNRKDYDNFCVAIWSFLPRGINVVTDSHAQSCLWSSEEFYRMGVAYKAFIKINDAVLVTHVK